MEELLARAGSQAVSLALRSGINIAGGYAIGTLTKFLRRLPEGDRREFERIKERLQTKILIITPAIDLIELNAARGNNSLASTLELTRDLKHSIEVFQQKLEDVEKEKNVELAMKEVQVYSADLLERIEESIPLINLALTTSGANLTSGLPSTVSPGRLLQASRILNRADENYNALRSTTKIGSHQRKPIQVGPEYELTIYSVYAATAHTDAALGGGAEIAWKEDYVRAKVRLLRLWPTDSRMKYSYEIEIVEDFDDGRYHDEEEAQPRKRNIDVSTIMKLSFTASGKLLEIEESNSPVLTLKMNKHYDKLVRKFSPGVTEEYDEEKFHREMAENEEWIALEMYGSDDSESDNDNDADSWESESDSSDTQGSTDKTADKDLSNAMEQMTIGDTRPSLSLLEYLIRLSALQANDQESIYNIQDERIALYLRDDSGIKRTGSETASDQSSVNVSTPPSASSKRSSGRRRISGRHRASTSPSPRQGVPRATPRENKDSQATVSTPMTPWEHDILRKQLFRNVLGVESGSPVKRQSKPR